MQPYMSDILLHHPRKGQLNHPLLLSAQGLVAVLKTTSKVVSDWTWMRIVAFQEEINRTMICNFVPLE